MPAEVILDTTAPNTPNNDPGNLPEYQNLSPPPPCEVEPLEALARKTAPSESLDETYVKEVSQTSSDIQRVQNLINLYQHAFNGLTYLDLQQIDSIHHPNKF